MKEMVGGCCVCSDDRGWAENPLVYCDGQGCTVAVHQACYGIVTVPTGNWYCRKCESQERSTKVRCELCPSRDGALKPTDNNAWAHVVCALYIPEVRFGNVTTMEPIILHQIPQERYNKTCYICEEGNKGSRASVGACMQCNKAGCRQQFHVTCAQSLGLLCEEAGNYLDNVKYCGYCHHHYTKLKKGGNVKPIPPYRPVPGGDSPEASPSKEHDPKLTAKRKMSTGGGSTSGGGKTKPDEGVVGLQGGLGGGGVPGGPGGLDEELSSLSLPPTSQPNLHSLSQESLNSEQAKLLAKKRKGGKSSQTGSPDPGSSPRPLTPGKPLPSPSNTSPSGGKPVGSIVVQVPLEAAMGGGATPLPHAASPPSADQPHDLPAKRARSQSSDKSDKSRRPKRGSGSGTTGGSGSGTSSSVLTSDRQLSTKVSLNPTPPPSVSTIKAGSPESIVDTLQSLPRPKKTNIKEEKDIKLFQNGVSAPHMLGNQLNPSSTMAQKMCDTLSQEVAAHSIFSTEPNLSTSSNLVGPQLPKHHTQTGRAPSANSAASINLGAGGGLLGNPTNGVTWSNSIPQSLDQLLERQWEQGSQFLMEQAQHFDIASLLSCLHQLRAENAQLEEHVNSLLARRDHLLAVNARLAIPLVPPQVNSVHNNVGGGGGGAGGGRTAAVVENGLGETYHAAPRPPNQPNQPSARGGCTGAGYNLPAVTQSSVVVRASPDPQHRRVGSGVTPGGGAYTNALYSSGQASTSAQSQVVIRRSEVDSHTPNLPPSTKPS